MRILAHALQIPKDANTLRAVKKWLGDKKNGPWVMVIDGIDDTRVAKKMYKTLPQDRDGRVLGQVLITTKDRDVLTYFLEASEQDYFIHVGDLKAADNRKIFTSHARKVTAKQAGKLVERGKLDQEGADAQVAAVTELITPGTDLSGVSGSAPPPPPAGVSASGQPQSGADGDAGGPSSNEEEKLEQLYEKIAWPLGQKYGHPYDAFKLALTSVLCPFPLLPLKILIGFLLK